jgi:CHAT domain-containing protein
VSVRFSRRQKQWSNENKALVRRFIIIIIMTGEFIYSAALMAVTILRVGKGVKTLVMSLWKVPDIHTQELMKSFYEHLKEGYKVLDALKKARLIIMKDP